MCVLDAVFSINAHYNNVVNVYNAYADYVSLPDRLLPAADAHTVIGADREQSVAELAKLGRELGGERLAADVLVNRSLTSMRGDIRKADAAVQYAQILADSGLQRIDDVAAAPTDTSIVDPVEARLAQVPGHGQGTRLSYLWMLAGDDNRIKPDRMIRRWPTRHLRLDTLVSVAEARDLLAALASRLGCTQWELDHAVWQFERSGRPRG
ncbi:hypothetical protein [Amycolatopsis echigonensis]|uniref:Uncharacterized protein n=1 Tax=Amycolatopsis echigonensis TaxID=2576905 RepID=A0A2N3WSS6_9PSEU|nr:MULTISPECIES: hypothetical protein [Amycolatopsis]MBB2498770.1 hypothetical protein [Amycolatopsis echigonensis]PKV96928.1 hypothetical protein ATK30_7893 [Amycolatopsis niigatensis]